MNRFDTYVPIKFDVPMFTPDFAALEALQTQKQKTLDDFRNQTDLIASSIKDDPKDPTVKEKKIKDIMASKDAIVNEMLRNPSKGNALLGQFQSNLKNDILFGDISKVNARATDYEQKIADLKTQPLWNDPIWRKGAIESIKNSYGDFQTAEGFGKTKGDDFAHTYYTVPERDAILNSYTDKVAHEMYDSKLQANPELASSLSFDTFYSQMKTDELSYKRLLEAALPQALADTRLQDFYETEGKLRGLGEGQGQIRIKKDKNGKPIFNTNGDMEIDDNTLFGQALHGNLLEKVYKNTGRSYIKGSNDKLRDEINFQQQQDLQQQQFAHADAQFEKQKSWEKYKFDKELELKAAIADQEKKQKAVQGIQTEKAPGRLLDIPATQINTIKQEVEKSKQALEDERKGILKQFQDNGNKFVSNEQVLRYKELNKQIESKNKQIANYNDEINKLSSNSQMVKIVFGNPEVNYADLNYQMESTDNLTINTNDYSANELQKIAKNKGFDLQADMLASITKGENWEQFKKNSKAYKAIEGSGGDWFGKGNSAYDIYTTAQAKYNAGQFSKGFAQENEGVLLSPANDNKQAEDYYKAGFNGMRNGTIKDISGLTIQEVAANKSDVKPEKIVILNKGREGNETTYKIEGGKPDNGYYNVYYKVDGDKEIHHIEGWAKNNYEGNTAFQNIHNTYSLGAIDDKGNFNESPNADYIIQRRIEDNPQMLGDLSGIQEMKKFGDEYKLNAEIPTKNGMINLSDNGFKVILEGGGRYRVHYNSNGEDREFSKTALTPSDAYISIYKFINEN